MTKYFKVTEKELLALKDVSDSMTGMSGGDCEDFDKEARRGKKAIDSILKRANKKRNENEYSSCQIRM